LGKGIAKGECVQACLCEIKRLALIRAALSAGYDYPITWYGKNLPSGKGGGAVPLGPLCGLKQRRFPVDHKILSRHTANAVLKQAGIPKQF
jgi:hypothetical protein